MSPGERLAALRAELLRRELDGLLVPRADEHLGEYVPACAERLAWLTGFTGSAGLAIVLADRAVAFSDGRYVLQLAAQTDPAQWERAHLTEDPPPAWLARALKEAVAGPDAAPARIGYDPWLFSEEQLARYAEAGLALVPTSPNPVDAVWQERPAPPAAPAVPHGLEHAGVASATKRAELARTLREAGQDAAVITDPASLAWLLNLRGADVECTPLALGYAVLHADARVSLFMDPAKLGPESRAWLGNEVTTAAPDQLPAALAALAGRRVRVDAAGSPAWFARTLREAGAEVVAGADPCLLPKARKNPVEQQGARDAQARDAVAVCRFLHWLEGAAAGHETEMSAAARLLAYRAEDRLFRGESFPAISGAGENGAIIHYRVTPQTDRAIGPDEVYLSDSGGQYLDGTTDVTRTVWTGPSAPPAQLRERFTRVLRGNVALARLVFPQGVAGPHIDALARAALWQAGLDYDHGTGHGVGSFLSVHEGPASISRAARTVAIEAGMILSDEPGFYLPGAYGIRLETLLLAQPAALPDASKPFLRFEVLTLAPFDRRLIEPALLEPGERAWLDAYHARVLAVVEPGLEPALRGWLRAACAPL